MRCIQRCSCQLVLLQGCLFVIFKRCPGVWFLTTGKKANITLIFDDRKEDSGSSKLVSLAWVSRKIAEPAGSHFQANRQEEGEWEQPEWIMDGQIIPDELVTLGWKRWLCGCWDTSASCLPWLYQVV